MAGLSVVPLCAIGLGAADVGIAELGVTKPCVVGIGAPCVGIVGLGMDELGLV